MTINHRVAADGELPSGSSDIKLELLSSRCGNSSCPTIYRTDRGTLVVQGYAVAPDRAGVSLPDGELLVEIPAELLAEAARAAF